MKFKLHQSQFLEALNSVQGVVGNRSQVPILSNVLIEAKEEELTFTTTDYDMTMRYRCKAEISEEGAITLPVKRLASIVRELSENIVEVTTDSRQQNTVSMKCGSYRCRITGISASQYPDVQEKFTTAVSYKLEQSVLQEMLHKTFYAASTDDARPAITGLMLSFTEGKLTCIATDGRRLALFWAEVEYPAENEKEVILSPRTVSELMRSLDKGEVRLTIQDDARIVLEYGNRYMSAKLMTGTYPDYKRVIFTDCDNKIKINREDLLSVLRRINVTATPMTSAMRLTFEDNLLTITVTAPDIDDATDTVTIKYDGAPITTIYNPTFMMDPLKNLTSDEITLEINSPATPALIKDDSNFLYVIMPLRV